MFDFSCRRIVLFPVVCVVLSLPSVLWAAGPTMRMTTMTRPPMMMPAPMAMPAMQPRMMPGMMGMPSGHNFMPMAATGNQFAYPGTGSGYLMSPGYGSSAGSGSYRMSSSSYSGNGSSMMTQRGYPSSGTGRVGGEQQGSSVQGSGLDWPLGTRLLADGEPLRHRIDAAIGSLRSQSAQGRVDPELVAGTIREIEELRVMIVRQGGRGVVSETTIRSAVQFLDDLASQLRSL
jgi:hypothetical protein